MELPNKKYSTQPYGIFTGNYHPNDTSDLIWVYVANVDKDTGMVKYQPQISPFEWKYMHCREFRKKYYRDNR